MPGAVRTLLLAAMALLAGIAAPASASPRAIFPQACILPAEEPLSFAEARVSEAWSCPARAHEARARHAWLRFDGDLLPAGRARIAGDAMATDGLLLVAVGRDGALASRYWTQHDLARQWSAGTRFAIPLGMPREAIETVYLRFDAPIGRQAATTLAGATREEIAGERLQTMAVLAIFTGMLAIVALYSGLMAIALRSWFAMFHFAAIAFLIVYTVSSSSLIFLAFPGLSLWERSILSYGSLALSMALMVPFALGFLEPGMCSPRMRRIALASAGLLALAAFALPVTALTGIDLRDLYHLCYVPPLLATVCAIAQAWRRGSRAAKAFVLACAIPLLSAAERILRSFDLSPFGYRADFGFYVAMALESVAMTVAIAWRVIELRRERDSALRRGEQLAGEAATDALTGLPNRRDFGRRAWRASDSLGIVDLDRFKAVNDRYGHDAGDAVLQAAARTLAGAVARGELLRAWRLGGEEFGVAIEADSIEAAAIILNRVRDRIASEAATAVPQLDARVTASAGLALVGPSGVDHAYRAADSALYHAKAGGRDRLCYEGGRREIATIFPRRAAA